MKHSFKGELYDYLWNGIIYDIINNIQYELNEGKGYVKQYNYNGKLIFEGEYLNGKKWNGKGKADFEGFDFEGEWLNEKEKDGKEKNIILIKN